MDADERDSRRLSRILRHRRNVSHDDEGWVLITDVAKASGMTEWRIRDVATINHRYSLSGDGLRVRAHHGHSNGVSYDYTDIPPEILYHGTSTDGHRGIMESGAILPMGRDAVHLSLTPEYAYDVARRRGEPVVLAVDAGRMHRDGFGFHLSDDGVYLTERVPVEYISSVDHPS